MSKSAVQDSRPSILHATSSRGRDQPSNRLGWPLDQADMFGARMWYHSTSREGAVPSFLSSLFSFLSFRTPRTCRYVRVGPVMSKARERPMDPFPRSNSRPARAKHSSSGFRRWSASFDYASRFGEDSRQLYFAGPTSQMSALQIGAGVMASFARVAPGCLRSFVEMELCSRSSIL